jgi:hypothetical protein
MMAAVGGNRPYAVFSDSLEVNASDWTGDFLDEFRKRRGYDLAPLLPALVGDAVPDSASIRHDWGRTLTELAEERYLTPVREWAARNGTRFRSQTYGTPPVSLSSNALADLPEGEGWQWRRVSSSRWASSAAHFYGRPVVSSETWTWLHSPAFRATPLDIKAEADLHFLQGINQLVGHGWPYSPPGAGEPGWRFYAAAVLNQHNPWWPVMPEVALYLQRVSFLLRQGKSVADIAIYLPTDDAWAGFRPGRVSLNEAMDGLLGPHVIPQILGAGYSFDFIDDAAIARGGLPYAALVLPGAERMPLDTLRRIAEYARAGGIVLAARRPPSLAPGLKEAGDTPAIRELARALFEGGPGRLVRDATTLGAELRARLAPDMAGPVGVGFVHRRLGFADVYFLANTSNHRVRGRAAFRVADLAGAWWNPSTGEVTGAGGKQIELDLEPYESRVLVFWEGHAPAGARPLVEAAPVAGPWQIAFDGAPAAAAVPGSWTEDPARRFFSGQAVYTTSWQVPPPLAASGRRLWLDFGEGTPVAADEKRAGSGMRAMLESPVREAAVVWVNGKRAGAVWRPPYRVEVTGLVRAGANSLRVEVGNTAINALARGPLPDYRKLNARYGERFQPQDMKDLAPLPSGLLAPVRLLAERPRP